MIAFATPTLALSRTPASPAALSTRTFIGTQLHAASVATATRPAAGARQTPRMFSLSFLLPFQRKDVVALPQKDTKHADDRQAALDVQRLNYEWTKEGVANASLMKDLPDGEFPKLSWLDDIVLILLRVALNGVLNAGDDLLGDTEERIFATITGVFSPLLPKIITGTVTAADGTAALATLGKAIEGQKKGAAKSLAEQKDLFKNIKLDAISKADQFLLDDIFGWYRVAGPNPMRLTRLRSPVQTMFPELTDGIVNGIRGFENDSLARMAMENRLYYVEYSELDGVPTGKDQEGKLKDSFVYSPICLLAVPLTPTDRDTVLPLAIRCGQDPKTYPMYTSNKTHTNEVTWLAAKVTVQVSDALVHEAVYHLARTHLLVGIFVCATHRTLPSAHPLYRLLKCHFYGTAFINNAATSALINDGGTIDQITAPDIGVTRQLSADGVNGTAFKFNDWFPDVELAARGVMDPALRYPFRDDALALWPVVVAWVRDYLSAYYKSDADVVADMELRNWCAEIVHVDCGNLHGFGETATGEIKTLDYLVRTTALVIFTATCQHAAVNFSQATLMQFAPGMPLGGYAPAPTTDAPFKNLNDMVTKMYPDLARSEKQLHTAELIGVLKYGQLGEYGRDLQFAPDEVDDYVEEFKDRLGVIGARIQERNKKERKAGLPVYKHLVPKNIPNSINI